MVKIITCTIFILHAHFAYAQFLQDFIPSLRDVIDPNRQRPSDPVQTFFSGLGNLILDIDSTFSRQLAPKVNAEDQMKEQMYGRPRAGAGYFHRIRENYKDVQRRLGESLGKLDLRMSSDIGSVKVQNKGPESKVDVSLPFLPMKLAVEANQGLETSDTDKINARNMEPGLPSPQIKTSLKLGNTEINVDSNLGTLQPSEMFKNAENQIRKTLDDLGLPIGNTMDSRTEENLQKVKLNNKHKSESDVNLDKNEFSPRSVKDSQTSEPSQLEDSSPEGRILGDVLYSEDTFDKLTKRVMKDAKWVINPKAFPSRVVETLKQLTDKAINDISKANVANDKPVKKPEEATTASIPQQTKRDSVTHDLKKRKSIKPQTNDVKTAFVDEEIIFISEPDNKLKFQTLDNQCPKDTVILAFTPEGVPLKLRMGPKVVNPLKFLDKALRTYRVSLNIPVASHDDIEPVGREILQLGTGSGRTVSRALYIDLSDSFQLESLLRTLKRTKMQQEIQSEGTDQDGF